MATINNKTYATFVKGTESADNISNYHFRVTISAGAGNDSIQNIGNVYVSGDNYLYGRFAHDASINAGAGDDSILNYDDSVTILGGDGKDTVDNDRMNAVISGDAGNDSIVNSNWGNNSTLKGGKGNDFIKNYADNITVEGGVGNDIINIAVAGSVVNERTLESAAKNTLVK